MSKKSVKILSAVTCAAVITSCIGIAAFAKSDSKIKTAEKDKKSQETTKTVSASDTSEENSKEETVYVIAGADGSVKKIIVSDWIKNSSGNTIIDDNSELSDIVNVKGEESFEIGSDQSKVWDAENNDIYYQGNIKKELPVDLKVSYKLDGKSITPDELKGKSGHVTIRFDYTNNQYETVNVNGKDEKIYVPFAMLTGVILDNEKFSNIEVSNGKLVNDGTRSTVMGIAFPGLQEDLAIDKEKIDIPDYVEISADVKNFKLGMTVTLATNDAFNSIDTEKLDKVDELSGKLDELTDGMNKLLNGSSELYNGLSTLLDKSKELTAGIDKICDGAAKLKTGADNLDAGANKIKNGATELSDGLNTLASNNDALNGGATKVFETLLSTAETQIREAGIDVPTLTIDNYADALNTVIKSLDKTNVYNKALQTVTSTVEGKRDYITAQVTAAVKAEVESKVTAAVKAEVEAKVTAGVKMQLGENADAMLQTDAVKATIQTNVDAQMASDAVKQMIAAKTDEQMNSNEIKAVIAQNTEAQVKKAISDNMAGNEVQAKLKAADEGAKKIIALKTSLDSYNSFYIGLRSYTDGVEKAASGANELKTGASTLKDGTGSLAKGAGDLYNGILTMKNGVPALVDGITKLRDGSMQLSDGLKEFDEKGVKKIVDVYNNDVSGLIERIKVISEVSKNYNNFSGISDDMEGKVKFIYRTEEIGE
ncbi:MAG: hypothetical protein K6G26_03840 [Lachnospiraceae bacterium]|nr:hypothetical protein [Lachnospiraceae bacterium]